HPAFLMALAKRGLGLLEHWRLVRGSCASRQFASGPERGRFPWRPRSAISLSVTAPCSQQHAPFP
ncbi:hypothetical protein CPA58_07575, partial [Klebsiella pneumoniae]